jgi:hypothetical protein
MEGATIIQTRETFRIDESGATVKMRVILWRSGKDGPFTLEIPESQFTAERVRQELERMVAELHALRPPGSP